jgi:Domain of unknown function (DUF4326)
MTSPRRIQLRRTRGWRKPPGAVVVSRPSRWANPYPAEVYGQDEAVRLYYEHVLTEPGLLATASVELADRDLACWCPPGEPCHADLLLYVASTVPR